MTANAGLSREHIVTLYTHLLEAWNQRDAGAYASLFTERASVIGFDGSQMNGPNEIASTLGAIFSNHPTAAYVAKVREVRPLDSQVVLLRGVVGMIPPEKDELNPAANAVQSLVVVLESGEPKVALFQNTPAAFHGRPHLSEELTEELTAVLRSGRIVEAD